MKVEFFSALVMIVGDRSPEQEAALDNLAKAFSATDITHNTGQLQVCLTPRMVVQARVEEEFIRDNGGSSFAILEDSFRKRLRDGIRNSLKDLSVEAGRRDLLEQYHISNVRVIPVAERSPVSEPTVLSEDQPRILDQMLSEAEAVASETGV